MTLPLSFLPGNFNPEIPIPNGSFYTAEQSTVNSSYYPLVVGGGLAVNYTTATLAVTGASGSFTTVDGKTVTVVNGVITSIV